jgi:hypothetical protein
MKYQKSRYNIFTEVYSNASSLFTSNDYSIESSVRVFGVEYFSEELKACCGAQVATKTNYVKVS